MRLLARHLEIMAAGDTWHLLNCPFVLQVLHVVLVKVLFVDDCLSVEKTFGECVVLSFNPFGLLLANDEIQTGGLIVAIQRG